MAVDKSARDSRGKLRPSVFTDLKEQFESGKSIMQIRVEMDLAGHEIASILRTFGQQFEMERDIRYDQLCSMLMNTMRKWAEMVDSTNPSDARLFQEPMAAQIALLGTLYDQAQKWRSLPARKGASREGRTAKKKTRRPTTADVTPIDAAHLGVTTGASPDDIFGPDDDDDDEYSEDS